MHDRRLVFAQCVGLRTNYNWPPIADSRKYLAYENPQPSTLLAGDCEVHAWTSRLRMPMQPAKVATSGWPTHPTSRSPRCPTYSIRAKLPCYSAFYAPHSEPIKISCGTIIAFDNPLAHPLSQQNPSQRNVYLGCASHAEAPVV